MEPHTQSALATLSALGSDRSNGLSEAEALSRRKIYGENTLIHKKKKNIFLKFFLQFKDFMIIILLICAVISFVLSLIRKDADFLDPIIILCIVTMNALLGTLQEAQAQKAIDSLKKMTAPTACVIRDGIDKKIDAAFLVPGDIIILRAGDFVPADARLITCSNLLTNESALTGEAEDSAKNAQAILSSDSQPGDRTNMVFASTVVTKGHATAVVTNTAMNTAVGKIAGLLNDEPNTETPLQAKLSSIGKSLAIIALIICALVFFVGILHRFEPLEMFMTSVSLAVAAIPEGLPAIVTIMLAIGVTRMAQKRAIVRHLPAVETLGSATVICSDKTGTLTQNKMTVSHIEGDPSFVLSLGALCSDIDGNATDRAILAAAESIGIKKDCLDKTSPRLEELSFDSVRKMMTTIHRTDSGYRCISKGAPDVLLKKCNRILKDGSVCAMTSYDMKAVTDKNAALSARALRMIAICYKDDRTAPEEGLIFAGLIGITDPPRPEAAEAVRLCRRAGIRTVMITGDHIVTASAIARQLKIMGSKDIAVTGAELDGMTDDELAHALPKIKVFARVSPEHKARIVRTMRACGEVVAMTGDGVNDAPALKAADIGCAMGKSGTDVARGAADIVLTDDNFATIVAAVRLGRGIYANIQKATHFLLSSNIGEILLVFFGILFGKPTPLLAIQLLWVNLVTDSLPAIALGLDAPDALIMDQKPIPKSKGFFADGLWAQIIIEGCMIGALALLAFSIGANIYDLGTPTIGRTMAFCTLSLSQLVHAFNMRTKRSVFSKKEFNPYLLCSFLLGTALQCGVVVISPLAKIFKVAVLSLEQWLIVAVLSVVPILFSEFLKWCNR